MVLFQSVAITALLRGVEGRVVKGKGIWIPHRALEKPLNEVSLAEAFQISSA